jgi:plasmid stabilization system protein ParE
MSRRIIVHSEARSDVIDIAYYIAEDSLAAADRFAEAIDAAYRRLAAMPALGATRESGKKRLQLSNGGPMVSWQPWHCPPSPAGRAGLNDPRQ